jgi:hypothetical protein
LQNFEFLSLKQCQSELNQAGRDVARALARQSARARCTPPRRPSPLAPSRGRARTEALGVRARHVEPSTSPPSVRCLARRSVAASPTRACRPSVLVVLRSNGRHDARRRLEGASIPHCLFKRSPPSLASSTPPPRRHGRRRAELPRPSLLRSCDHSSVLPRLACCPAFQGTSPGCWPQWSPPAPSIGRARRRPSDLQFRPESTLGEP